MKRVWQTPATILAGLFIAAMYAMPQAYTVSAKPGAVNYIQGHVYLDGRPLSDKGLRATFLNANDTLSTDLGKAEVLLTPGVFLRVGDNSQVRMVSASLTNTQVEVKRGEAMVEADGLLKDNNIQILDHGASITIEKNGLYRFTADDNPTAAVIDGKAEVYLSDKKVDIGKGHETLLAEDLKAQKFDSKKDDDLYAWSNVRAEYDAATSYQSAKNVTVNNYDYGGWGGYGFGPWYGPGWYWNSAFNGYGWIPGDGAAFSPFGWGFYGAGYLPYAPVMVVPVNGVGGGVVNGKTTGSAVVAVNANHPPAIGAVTSSPYANNMVRSAVANSFASTGGFRTATGVRVASSAAGRGFSGARAVEAPAGGHFASGGFSTGGAHASAGGGGHH